MSSPTNLVWSHFGGSNLSSESTAMFWPVLKKHQPPKKSGSELFPRLAEMADLKVLKVRGFGGGTRESLKTRLLNLEISNSDGQFFLIFFGKNMADFYHLHRFFVVGNLVTGVGQKNPPINLKPLTVRPSER